MIDFVRNYKKLRKKKKEEAISKKKIEYLKIFEIGAVRTIDLKSRGDDLKLWETILTSKTGKSVKYNELLGSVLPEISELEGAFIFQLNDSFLVINSLNKKTINTC